MNPENLSQFQTIVGVSEMLASISKTKWQTETKNGTRDLARCLDAEIAGHVVGPDKQLDM